MKTSVRPSFWSFFLMRVQVLNASRCGSALALRSRAFQRPGVATAPVERSQDLPDVAFVVVDSRTRLRSAEPPADSSTGAWGSRGLAGLPATATSGVRVVRHSRSGLTSVRTARPGGVRPHPGSRYCRTRTKHDGLYERLLQPSLPSRTDCGLEIEQPHRFETALTPGHLKCPLHTFGVAHTVYQMLQTIKKCHE